MPLHYTYSADSKETKLESKNTSDPRAFAEFILNQCCEVTKLGYYLSIDLTKLPGILSKIELTVEMSPEEKNSNRVFTERDRKQAFADLKEKLLDMIDYSTNLANTPDVDDTVKKMFDKQFPPAPKERKRAESDVVDLTPKGFLARVFAPDPLKALNPFLPERQHKIRARENIIQVLKIVTSKKIPFINSKFDETQAKKLFELLFKDNKNLGNDIAEILNRIKHYPPTSENALQVYTLILQQAGIELTKGSANAEKFKESYHNVADAMIGVIKQTESEKVRANYMSQYLNIVENFPLKDQWGFFYRLKAEVPDFGRRFNLVLPFAEKTAKNIEEFVAGNSTNQAKLQMLKEISDFIKEFATLRGLHNQNPDIHKKASAIEKVLLEKLFSLSNQVLINSDPTVGKDLESLRSSLRRLDIPQEMSKNYALLMRTFDGVLTKTLGGAQLSESYTSMSSRLGVGAPNSSQQTPQAETKLFAPAAPATGTTPKPAPQESTQPPAPEVAKSKVDQSPAVVTDALKPGPGVTPTLRPGS